MRHPPVQGCLVSFPTPEILLLTLNRPEKRNSVPLAMSTDIIQLWKWFDAEPTLRVAIITGTGESFCSGADLKGMSISDFEICWGPSVEANMPSTRMERTQPTRHRKQDDSPWTGWTPSTTKREANYRCCERILSGRRIRNGRQLRHRHRK